MRTTSILKPHQRRQIAVAAARKTGKEPPTLRKFNGKLYELGAELTSKLDARGNAKILRRPPGGLLVRLVTQTRKVLGKRRTTHLLYVRRK